MSWLHDRPRSSDPRVLLVSQRLVSPQLSRCLRFEFEDVVQDLERADLVAQGRPQAPHVVRRASSLLDRLVPGSSSVLATKCPSLSRRYEFVFVIVESMNDLLLMQPHVSWLLRKARASACHVDELWKKGFRRRTGEIRILRQFDRIFLSMDESVDEVAEVTGRPCNYLAPSVDALALCPYPDPPRRVIDLYAMGRRSAEMHQAFLAFAQQKGWFYLYDTVGNADAPSCREHRRHLGDLIRRSRYFVTYAGKSNLEDQTGGQHVVGFRYFEGSAAGAVLVGERPRTRAFDELFGWTDAVVQLPYGTRDVASCFLALESDPERVERIRRTNVVQSLLRHDHAHRWADVLRAMGLVETPAIEARRRELRQMAESIERSAEGRSVG